MGGRRADRKARYSAVTQMPALNWACPPPPPPTIAAPRGHLADIQGQGEGSDTALSAPAGQHLPAAVDVDAATDCSLRWFHQQPFLDRQPIPRTCPPLPPPSLCAAVLPSPRRPHPPLSRPRPAPWTWLPWPPPSAPRPSPRHPPPAGAAGPPLRPPGRAPPPETCHCARRRRGRPEPTSQTWTTRGLTEGGGGRRPAAGAREGPRSPATSPAQPRPYPPLPYPFTTAPKKKK